MSNMSDVIDILFDKDEAQKVVMSSYRPQPGYYQVSIEEAEMKTSKNDKPYMDIAAIATDPSNNATFKTFGIVWLTEGAKVRYGRFLSSIGLELSDNKKYKLKDFRNKQGIAAIYRNDSKYLRMQDFFRSDDVVLGPDPSLEPVVANPGKKTSSNFGEDTPF